MKNRAGGTRQLSIGLEAAGRILAGVVVLCTALAAGCGSKVTRPLIGPMLEGRVVDGAGRPVSGAHIGIYYDLPGHSGGATVRGGRIAPERAPLDGPPIVVPLLSNCPNPTWGSTILRMILTEAAAQVSLTIVDHANVLVKTLIAGSLPAGPYMQEWDGHNEAGRPVPPGVYIARLTIGGGVAATTQQVRMFRVSISENDVQEGYVALSAADGRFSLPMHDLPVGEVVPLRNASCTELGSEQVLTTMTVYTITDQGAAEARVDVGDMKKSVPVVLRLGSTTVTLRSGPRASWTSGATDGRP
jgi:hypothetical protein